MKIDIFYFTDDSSKGLVWNIGSVFSLSLTAPDTVSEINKLAFETEAEWILFWDANLGEPNAELIVRLTNEKCDVWHAGLKLGLSGLPDMINYINPAWIYNKDASSEIISSSFRLSIKASLIKRNVFQQVGGLQSCYLSIESAGLALGYSVIKNGGIIRYHPDLVTKQTESIIPETDEWRFLKQFYPVKWQYWVLLNKKGFVTNYKNWKKVKNIPPTSIKPAIHSSDKKHNIVLKATRISVLAPTLDRYKYLKNELSQLSEQIILPFEVLITDQTDADRRQIINSSMYPSLSIRYFPQDEKGQCIAWNKLLSEAKGDYVLFLGDDADNIKSDFIEKLLDTMNVFNADIVASHVIEIGAPAKEINRYYYMSDTFPITLAKKDVVLDAGGMDMFFNKNIRADYDLALRCHANGALMIFDSSAIIDHHRAPVGGLRAHKARIITNTISKHSVLKFSEPTSSEIFMVKKYFNNEQYKYFIRIKYFDQLMINGSGLKKLLRILVFIVKLPGIIKRYIKNLNTANKELANRASILH